MKPVFIDIHIHTSEDPENLNSSYDIDTLKNKIEAISEGCNYLVSLSDHNTINKKVYLEAIQKLENILLGVEIHIRNYDDAEPYHCHILFNDTVDAESIDRINLKLDSLYPQKCLNKNDTSIPKLEDIMNAFDEYDFLILPHGGQNHSTFDKSIPDGKQFDKTLERNIYYNHFDGFTARSNKSLDKTLRYFERLGIKDFVNLVTATDNYVPKDYPDCKAGREASEFIPTWMLAEPTFEGLRISLSESSRLKYGDKPDSWAECIQCIGLQKENININVKLTPGLNVVIGGSSSGKSLFVDTIYRKIVNQLDNSIYLETPYEIKDIFVDNPTGQYPHYLDQNYINKICDPKDSELDIDDISILKSVFPSDSDERKKISNSLSELNSQLTLLIQSVKEINKLQEDISRIPNLSHLIVTEEIKSNPLKYILPTDKVIELINYPEADFECDIKKLDELDNYLSNNPLITHNKKIIEKLKKELESAFDSSKFEFLIRDIVLNSKSNFDKELKSENKEIGTKSKQFEQLLACIKSYIKFENQFNESLNEISKFQTKIKTTEIESMGHKLSIENEFELTKDKFLEVVNKMLKSKFKIENFDKITPESLFENNFSKKDPKVIDYDDFEQRIKENFSRMNKRNYKILTKNGKDFDNLSPGWKTSIILDLILGWGEDNAPLIIDQPEDNLATEYMNHGLIKAIKDCKTKKQIILVSHNATIPMLGDAQNIVLCENDNNKITIRSSPLEGYINGTSVVDLIANKTDGGKPSIKKRVKKYNLKNFQADK